MQRLLLSIFFLACLGSLAAQTGQNRLRQDSILKSRDTTVVTVIGGQPLLQGSLTGKSKFDGSELNLSNALDHIPGIFKIHEAGFPLVYRGMTASRLRIERNGALRTGFVDQGYLLEDINPDNIAEIRVIRGAESVLYGTGGSGGVVQVNEQTAADHRKNSAYLSYSSNTHARAAGLRLGQNNGRFGWLISGRTSTADDFSYGGGETALNSGQEQQNLKLSLTNTNPEKNLQWAWNLDYNTGNIERPQGFQNNPFELRRYRNQHTYQSNFELKLPLASGARLEQNIWVLIAENNQEISNFNGQFTQLNVFENRSYDQEALGYRLNWYLNNPGPWKLRLGGDFVSSAITQRNLRDDFILQILQEEVFVQRRDEQMGGLFGMASRQLDKVRLDASLRIDQASIGDDTDQNAYTVLSGGVTLDWNQQQNTQHSLSLTRQFRYPTQLESVGVLFGGRGIFRGNPDIKPEFSYQLEWNMTRSYKQWEFGVNSWFSMFEDRITEVFVGNGEFTYENIEQARTYGLEARIDYQLTPLTSANLAYLSLTGTFTRGDDLIGEGWFSEGDPLLGIPPGRLRLSGRWQRAFTNKFSLMGEFDLDYTLEYDRLPTGNIRQTFGAQATEAYFLAGLNFSGRYKLNKQALQLGLRITNLTDSQYFPFGARIMGMGRNVTASLRFEF